MAVIMSGITIIGVGIGFIVVAVILFIINIIYKNTAAKRIKEELHKEYE
jgi:cell division protein FtsL